MKTRRKKVAVKSKLPDIPLMFWPGIVPLVGDVVIPRQTPVAMFRTVINITTIRIYFHNQLFVMMLRDEFVGFSSWIAGGDKYCACFYLTTRQIEVELDSHEKFTALLAEVDKSLGKE